MKITLFGATGLIGGSAMREALSRGHEVTVALRDRGKAARLPDGVQVAEADAASVDDVARVAAGQDLVISATRPPEGHERLLVVMAQALLRGTCRAGSRLLLVGGAGSLRVPSSGLLVIEDEAYLPRQYRPIAQACSDQLAVCQADRNTPWAYASPPALIAPGDRTGSYRLGEDDLVVDEAGVSRISAEDFAVALLDEAEQPRHLRRRFTAAY